MARTTQKVMARFRKLLIISDELQVKGRRNTYLLVLDESTDMNDNAQLVEFIRGVTQIMASLKSMSVCVLIHLGTYYLE